MKKLKQKPDKVMLIMDKLERIAATYGADSHGAINQDMLVENIAWLISEVESLRAELAALKEKHHVTVGDVSAQATNFIIGRLAELCLSDADDRSNALREIADFISDLAERAVHGAIKQRNDTICGLREALEAIKRRGVVMGSTGDYRQGQLDVLHACKEIVAKALSSHESTWKVE